MRRSGNPERLGAGHVARLGGRAEPTVAWTTVSTTHTQSRSVNLWEVVGRRHGGRRLQRRPNPLNRIRSGTRATSVLRRPRPWKMGDQQILGPAELSVNRSGSRGLHQGGADTVRDPVVRGAACA